MPRSESPTANERDVVPCMRATDPPHAFANTSHVLRALLWSAYFQAGAAWFGQMRSFGKSAESGHSRAWNPGRKYRADAPVASQVDCKPQPVHGSIRRLRSRATGGLKPPVDAVASHSPVVVTLVRAVSRYRTRDRQRSLIDELRRSKWQETIARMITTMKPASALRVQFARRRKHTLHGIA
jgi:hypothetical protein